ncbi:MAG: hypothetical protein IT345_08780 [Trueperaceae bacterium]|nr:hypothetical protein [Trueperaceae bacterium]
MIAFLLAIVVTEAVVEILVASELLAPLRATALARFPRAGVLLSCGYCLSVWAGVGIAYALGLSAGLGLGAVEPLVLGLAVHRLSNLWHEVLQRILHRLPVQLVLVRKEVQVAEPEPEEGA